MTGPGSPTPFPIMLRSPRISRSSMRWLHSLKARSCEDGQRDAFFEASVSSKQREPVRALRTRARHKLRHRRAMAFRLWEPATGMTAWIASVKAGKARASGSAGSFIDADAFARSAEQYVPPGSAARLAETCDTLEGSRLSSMAGTAIGIAAPISTMERRWARSPTTNAASIRLHSPGASFRAQRTRYAPRAPWRQSINISSAETKSSRYFSRRPSTIEPDPGYIKGYPAGIRENGGQYTHGAIWVALASAMQGDGDKAGELLSMLNPINQADNPNGVHRYKVEPYVVCADRLLDAASCRAWWLDLVYRIGRMDVSRGARTGSGFRLQGASLMLDPCIPGLARLRNFFPLWQARYDIRSKTRLASAAA